MRAKAIFTVFGRRLVSGKRVYYYQCYDDKGKRQWARSTGLCKKTEAVAYCMKLFRDGLLIPEQKVPTFGEFSDGWWDDKSCAYLKRRQLHDPLSAGSIYVHKMNFEKHIKDYFAKYRLDEITPLVIENWLLFMSEKKYSPDRDCSDEKKRKLKPKTINLVYVTFMVMMGEAFRLKLITNNPCREVKKLRAEEITRDILSVEEARKLFPSDWSTIWDDKVIYLAHHLAACTGVRVGELLGLRGEYVFDDYIFIKGQWTKFGYVPHTKTKHNRNIPIPLLMRKKLDELLKVNGNGFVFSEDGGKMPVAAYRINRQFDAALEKIGISREEKLKRNISFHAWRHFFNTLLLMSNVADKKVQSVTGHRSAAMTEHYTHFDTRQFTEVRDVQTELLSMKELEGTITKSHKDVLAKKIAARKRAVV